MPSRSLYLEYGGDFVVSPQGGLVVAEDSVNEATSTNQRIQRMLFTTPQTRDEYGNVVARGDSLYYPDFGVGIGRYVDAVMGDAQIAALRSEILEQLAQDPGIERQPAPVVTIKLFAASSLSVQVQYTVSSGQVYNTPEYTIGA